MRIMAFLLIISSSCFANSVELYECEQKIDYSSILGSEDTFGTLMEGVQCTNGCIQYEQPTGPNDQQENSNYTCVSCPQPQQIQSPVQGYFITSNIKFLRPGESAQYKEKTYYCNQ